MVYIGPVQLSVYGVHYIAHCLSRAALGIIGSSYAQAWHLGPGHARRADVCGSCSWTFRAFLRLKRPCGKLSRGLQPWTCAQAAERTTLLGAQSGGQTGPCGPR